MLKSISRSWCCSELGAVRLLGLGLILGAAPSLAAGQSVTYLKFSPPVISVDATSPVLLEVELSGVPTRVNLEFQPLGSATTILELNDAGSGGDRVAGDRTYSVRLSVAPIQNALRADDVHRVFIGFLNLFNGSRSLPDGIVAARSGANADRLRRPGRRRTARLRGPVLHRTRHPADGTGCHRAVRSANSGGRRRADALSHRDDSRDP